MSLARRALGDLAVQNAQRLQPDLPEVHLATAFHLYITHRDYERARVQLAMAKRALPHNCEVALLEAYMDRRQGNYEKAVDEFNQAIAFDPLNLRAITEFANTLFFMRQFAGSERLYDRAIDLVADYPMLKVLRATNKMMKTGDDTAFRSALAALPSSMSDDRAALTWSLTYAMLVRDWRQAKNLVDTMNGGEDDGGWFFNFVPVPIGCYSILLARFQGEQLNADSLFNETRERLSQMVQTSAGNAKQLSNLALIDAFLSKKDAAITEAKRAVEILPVSRDAVDGPLVLTTLVEVYAWTGELDLAFEQAEVAAKIPNGLYYGDLKLDAVWDPLRMDPRFDKLLAELAPRD
jgi:tetratricopeptide (TPR) repeat protein